VILNRETNEPVPLVEVFISGTTYGSITDQNGQFELITSYLPCQLVASHVSYAPFNKMIDAESLTYLTIRLIPYQHEIREISVASKSRRKENLELFKRGFLGTDPIAKSVVILNESALSFTWDSMVFKASADQPLYIENPKLGYRVKIILEDFNLIYDSISYNRIHRGRKIKPDASDALYRITGYYHFTPYPPTTTREQKQIKKNRLSVYYGSKMHFLRALYAGQLKSNGYRISPSFTSVPVDYPREIDTRSGITITFHDPEGTPDRVLVYPEQPMAILFFKDYTGEPVNLIWDSGDHILPERSEIKFANRKCAVRYNGTTLDYSLVFWGYMGEQRVAKMLPDDFTP
jgi:hypothetical protein